MAIINGFRLDDISNLLLEGDIRINADELFQLIRADTPPNSPTHVKTITQLYQVVDVAGTRIKG